VLLIRAGSFYFYHLTNQDRLPTQIHVDTQQALIDGVRRMDEMSYFRERIPDRFVIVEVRQDAPPRGLSEVEQRIFDLVDGMRSVDEIARESRLGEFETTKVLFHLIQLNVVQRRRDTNIKHISRITDPGRQADSLKALAETFNTVFRKIFAEVQAKGRQPVLESGLASFFEGATGFVELFRGVTMGPDGALDPAPLLSNLTTLRAENPIDFLYNGLNELLFFEMFTVGEALTREDEENLQQQLARIFRDHAQ
jgi:predicted transcriptional regulator